MIVYFWEFYDKLQWCAGVTVVLIHTIHVVWLFTHTNSFRLQEFMIDILVLYSKTLLYLLEYWNHKPSICEGEYTKHEQELLILLYNDRFSNISMNRTDVNIKYTLQTFNVNLYYLTNFYYRRQCIYVASIEVIEKAYNLENELHKNRFQFQSVQNVYLRSLYMADCLQFLFLLVSLTIRSTHRLLWQPYLRVPIGWKKNVFRAGVISCSTAFNSVL